MSQHALAVTFLPIWANAFNAIKDETLIRVESGNLHDSVEAFMTSNSDFLLSYASNDIFRCLSGSDVLSLEIGSDELVPVCGIDSHGFALFDINSAKKLKLLSHPPESFFGRLIQRECLPHLPKEILINNICENALSGALKALVLEGHGVAWLPRSLVAKELQTEKLKLLSDPMISLALKIKLYRLNQTRNECAEDFWVHLSDLYKG